MSEARRPADAGRRTHGRVGTVINGKWHVDARIGSGGMATVYAATHRNGHRAALKMLHTQLSRDAATRARFLREGYVANAVGHAGVVQVIDDDVTEDGAAFLVLELLEGETLEARRLRLGGALPIDEAIEVGEQALDALGAAHDKEIIHRDVKPENVFLTNDGVVKLLDFGLAQMKDATAEATKTGVTIGTPEFMPPEQAVGRRGTVDARSDVWGLGATLFTSITGKYVHEASTLHEQLVASATQRARPIRTLAPHVPPAVALVIDRALELEKQDRWPSAREMQQALREARGRRPEGFVADSLTVPVSSPLYRPLSSGALLLKPPPSSSSDPTLALPPPASRGPRDLSGAPPIPAEVSNGGAPGPSPGEGVVPSTRAHQVPHENVPSGSMPASGHVVAHRQSVTDFHSGTFAMDGAPLHPFVTQPMSGGAAMAGQSPGPPPVQGAASRALDPRVVVRVVVAVAVLLLLVGAALGAYVFWKAHAAAP